MGHLVDNYKWIGLAFTANEAIMFGASNWENENSNLMKIKTLGELTADAKILVSQACAVPGGDFTKSSCWPDLSAE